MCCTCGCGLALAMAEATEMARLEQQQGSDGRTEAWSQAPQGTQTLHQRTSPSVRGWEALKRSLRILSGTAPSVLDLHKVQSVPNTPTLA